MWSKPKSYRDSVRPSCGNAGCAGAAVGSVRPARWPAVGCRLSHQPRARLWSRKRSTSAGWSVTRPDGIETSDRRRPSSRLEVSLRVSLAAPGLLRQERQRQRSGGAALPGAGAGAAGGALPEAPRGAPSPRPGRTGPALPGPCRALQLRGTPSCPHSTGQAVGRDVQNPDPRLLLQTVVRRARALLQAAEKSRKLHEFEERP